MKIHNIRLGHATNSSSTHSIILTTKTVNDVMPEYDGFGWDFFTLSSKNLKALYLLATLRANCRNNANTFKNKMKTLVNKLDKIDKEAKKIISDAIYDNANGTAIDHQSILAIPRNFKGRMDMDYYAEFCAAILSDNIKILGGNDNSDMGHPLKELDTLNFCFPKETDGIVSRKDPVNKFWTLYNRRTGSKIRISFDDFSVNPVEKSVYPELIDIKITDNCLFNCKFCYQDSKPDGFHSNRLMDYVELLKSLRIFEVAIGGGEPTRHPHFLDFIKEIVHSGITPNFTTRDIEWLKTNITLNLSLFKTIGGIGVSITDSNPEVIDRKLNELEKIREMFGYTWPAPEIVIHYVMGLNTEAEMLNFLEKVRASGFGVLLLGRKTNGRGMEGPTHSYDNWIQIVKNLNMRVAIDTKLAAEYSKQLVASKIPAYMFTVSEGKFSMYIDAVNNTIGPSSYCEKDKMSKLSMNKEEWSEFTMKEYAKY